MTFLIPVFATGCGAAVLNDPVTAGMLGGGAVILLGTALTTGLLDWNAWRRRASAGI